MFENTTRYFKYKNTYLNRYNVLSFEINENENKQTGGSLNILMMDETKYSFEYNNSPQLYEAATQLSGDFIVTDTKTTKAPF